MEAIPEPRSVVIEESRTWRTTTQPDDITHVERPPGRDADADAERHRVLVGHRVPDLSGEPVAARLNAAEPFARLDEADRLGEVAR